MERLVSIWILILLFIYVPDVLIVHILYFKSKKKITQQCGCVFYKQKSPTLGEAEYVWRYNHRNDNIENQKILILKQLESQHL